MSEVEQNLNTEVEDLALDFFKTLISKKADQERNHLKDKFNDYSEYIINYLAKIKPDNDARLLRPKINEIEKKANQIEILSEELMEPFLLFVIGMGNYGKSTLVNSLIGKKVADIDVLPKTWKIDIFEKGDSSAPARIRFKDGSVEEYDKEEVKKYIEKEEKKREESEDKIEEKFQTLSKNLNSIEAKEELRAKLFQNILYKSPISEVHWPYEAENISLLNKFKIVDTPGLWQETNGEKTNEDLRDYYHKADGVIWLLDATTLASGEANKLIENLEESMELIGGKVDNVIAVLNSIDLVKSNGGEEQVQKVLNKAQEIYGDIFLDIVPISAKEAVEGLENNDFKTYQKSGLPQLRSSIERNFARSAARIKSKSKLNGLKGYLRDINQLIKPYKKRLKKDEKRRKKLEEQLNSEIKHQRKKIISLLDNYMDNYYAQVESNIESRAEKLFDFSEEEKEKAKSYIKNKIFDRADLKDKLNELQKRYEKILNMSYKKMARKSQFREFKHLDKETSVAVRNMDHNYSKDISINSSDISDKSSFGNFLTMAAGGFLLGPVGVIIGLIANSFGLVRWAVKKFKLPGLKDKLRSELDNIIQNIEEKVKSQINIDLEKIENKINKIREDSFAELHGKSHRVNTILAYLDNIQSLDTKDINYDTDVIKLIKE